MREKLFNQIMEQFRQNPEKAKRILNDKRPTKQEKDLVTAYLLMRKNKNHEAMEIISKIGNSQSKYVQAHIDLVRGIALLNLMEFSQSAHSLITAKEYFRQQGCEYFEVVTNINLFWAYHNVNDVKNMQMIFAEFPSIESCQEVHKVKLLLCRLSLSIATKDFENAVLTVSEIESQKNEMSESLRSNYLIDKFNLYLGLDRLDECKKTLEQLKEIRSYTLSANFKYMKNLLSNLMSNSTILPLPRQSRESNYLELQLDTLILLQERNFEAAKVVWNKLSQISPKTYLDDFQYVGQIDLFSLVLKKYRPTRKTDQEKREILGQDSVSKIREILLASPHPLSKEELYFQVWGERPRSKEDHARLAHAIYRMRKKYNINCKVQRGCYAIQKKEAA